MLIPPATGENGWANIPASATPNVRVWDGLAANAKIKAAFSQAWIIRVTEFSNAARLKPPATKVHRSSGGFGGHATPGGLAVGNQRVDPRFMMPGPQVERGRMQGRGKSANCASA